MNLWNRYTVYRIRIIIIIIFLLLINYIIMMSFAAPEGLIGVG